MASVAERVLECIEQLPDANSNDIIELLSDVPRGSVISALSNLYVKRKIVRNETRSPANRLMYTYRLVAPGSAVPAPTPRKYRERRAVKTKLVQDTVPFPTANGTVVRTDFVPQSKASMRGRIRQLEDEVAALRTWKQEALLRYPDLAVDPLILKARKIVADLLNKQGDIPRAKSVTAGQQDTTLIVRATFEALQAA